MIFKIKKKVIYLTKKLQRYLILFHCKNVDVSAKGFRLVGYDFFGTKKEHIAVIIRICFRKINFILKIYYANITLNIFVTK